eukprot:CAMPEP_0118919606 /NCGR_PEP_ID=MMETSP1166-20130328/18647_1 /TAXON_ID=1104430 /ORGANISM="Chrysoreinhardia sp, Strain CCMP3193" /LENGTH=178 /DNA_ID=CAMNT_0006860137 /DNA_START=167 /DNA_END=703 /DNA_ORIENTATION=+
MERENRRGEVPSAVLTLQVCFLDSFVVVSFGAILLLLDDPVEVGEHVVDVVVEGSFAALVEDLAVLNDVEALGAGGEGEADGVGGGVVDEELASEIGLLVPRRGGVDAFLEGRGVGDLVVVGGVRVDGDAPLQGEPAAYGMCLFDVDVKEVDVVEVRGGAFELADVRPPRRSAAGAEV